MGTCFGILGPNGAGKTTLVETWVGLGRPTSGAFQVLGCENLDDCRDRIGVSLQQMALPPKLTAAETVRLFASFYRARLDPETTLSKFDLRDQSNQQVRKLSGGQQQRLAVACALIGDPELLFLDEPTTGVDPASRRRIWQVLQSSHDRQRTIVITTHSMEEAAQLCQYVAIMNQGKVVAAGTPADLVSQHIDSQRIRFRIEPVAEVDIAAWESIHHVTRADADGQDFYLDVTDTGAALHELIRWLDSSSTRLVDLQIERGNLEDVYLKLLDLDHADA